MVKKPILKKFKNNLKIAIASTLILGAVVSSFAGCSSHQRAEYAEETFINSEYASEEQEMKLAKDLQCDYSYMFGHKYRLAHNNGKPIYVTFSEDYPEKLKNATIESLDYIFGLLNGINELYHYEIVDDYDSISSYSNIRYKFGITNRNDAGGQAFLTTNTIEISEDIIDDYSHNRRLYYVVTHELLHLLGFRDVYDEGKNKVTDTFYNTTFMRNTNYEDKVLGCLISSDGDKMILPNDYACLVASYMAGVKTESDYVYTARKAKALVSKYEKNFWTANFNKEVNGKFEIPDDITLEFSDIDTLPNGEVCFKYFTFDLEKDRYSITVKDIHKTLETYNGRVVRVGNIVVLKNVRLQSLSEVNFEFRNSEDIITDLVLSMNSSGNGVEICDSFGEHINNAVICENIEEQGLIVK